MFDYVVIDEAGQSLNSLLMVGINGGKKFIMAGDHKQLPPTIKQKDKSDNYKTLFEELIERQPELSSILSIQYRMNENIMKISSEFMYSNRLVAA